VCDCMCIYNRDACTRVRLRGVSADGVSFIRGLLKQAPNVRLGWQGISEVSRYSYAGVSLQQQ
jgi:hypothetical protein